MEKHIQHTQYVAKIWKGCYASDPTDGLEPVNNGWKLRARLVQREMFP